MNYVWSAEQKMALIASENVRKSRITRDKWKKTRKTRGKSAKHCKKRRKCEKKNDFATFQHEKNMISAGATLTVYTALIDARR